MLKVPCRKGRNQKDPEFASKLAKAVIQMGKVNSRIAKLSVELATKSRRQKASSLSRPSGSEDPGLSQFSDDRLAGALLDAFDMSDDEQVDEAQPESGKQEKCKAAVDLARQRAVARQKARLRFAEMYRRFVQRRYPLTWERVLRQECQE